MSQGIHKSFIFNTSNDINHYLKILYRLIPEYPIKIIAYCIMNNHTHLLFNVKDIKKLSKYMHRVNTSYAIYYNKKYNFVGPVFRGRFKSQPIYNDNQLHTCINYIFNNPVKAGICINPSDYPYSNYFKLEETVAEDFIFMEDEENKSNLCHELVENFLITNHLTKKDLKNDRKFLKELIILTKIKYGISYRKLEIEIGISKDVLRKIQFK